MKGGGPDPQGGRRLPQNLPIGGDVGGGDSDS